jgi:hypothetical protein
VLALVNNLKRKNSELQKEIRNLKREIPGTSKQVTSKNSRYIGELPSESSLELISDLELSSKTFDDSLILEKSVQKTPEKRISKRVIEIEESSDSLELIPKKLKTPSKPGGFQKSIEDPTDIMDLVPNRLKTPSKPDGFMASLSEVIKNSPLKSKENPSTSKTPTITNKRRIISETDSDPDLFNFASKEDDEEIPCSQPDSESIYNSSKRVRRSQRKTTPRTKSQTPSARRSLMSSIERKMRHDENENKSVYEQDTEDIFGLLGESFIHKIT